MIWRQGKDQRGLRLVLSVGVCWFSTIGCSGISSHGHRDRSVTVGRQNADVAGDDSGAIQTAIDRVARAGGGTVVIKAGAYILRSPVRLANHVTIRGEGAEKTILKKAPDVRSPLKQDADSTDLQATVEDAGGFTPGMGVMIFDKRPFQGLFPNVRTIRRIEGANLFFDDYVALDYTVRQNGAISNSFPLLLGLGVEDVSIRDLTVDGDRSGRETSMEQKAGTGGVYFYRAKQVSIRNVVARNVAGDGISTQFVQDPVIENCESYSNSGLGIHLGTEALHGVVRHNRSHDNGEDGLYLCWDVQHGIFEENESWSNGRDGVSIGHRDTDNTFVKNVIRDNGRAGIEFRDEAMNPGNRNTFRENVIENNGRPDAPGYGVRIEGATRDIALVSNTIRESRATGHGIQHVGVYIGPHADYITCEGNSFGGSLSRTIQDDSTGGHNKLAQVTESR